MSLRLKALKFVFRLVVKPRLRRVKTPHQIRREFNLAAMLLFKPFGVTFTKRGTTTEITGPEVTPQKALLYLHGGGYVAGSPHTHRGLLGKLAKLTKLKVIAPDYRLAPEHPLPTALEDALTTWDDMLSNGLRPQDIILAGDSAGGGLALSLLAQLCQRGTPPCAVIAFSPWTDLTGSGGSIKENAAKDPLFPTERFSDLVGFTLGDVPAADPRISPLFAEFPNAPPVMIQVGADEILRNDSTRMAERLREFGTEVQLEIWPDVFHVWQIFGVLPEANGALNSARGFLKNTVGTV